MPIRKQAQEAAKAVFGTLALTPDERQERDVVAIIERTMVAVHRECSERSAKVALDCCEEDQDMAHKIAAEIRRSNAALIANLSSLR